MGLRISRRDFDAAVFDLDGVLTDTAVIHAAAWKSVFDYYLRMVAARRSEPFLPFDAKEDYLAFVDGRPRYDGVRTFLGSRGITLPEGSEGDPEDAETIQALGDRKARLVLEKLGRGVDAMPGAEALLQDLRRAGMKIAVASSSKNCAAVLAAARLDGYVDVRTDGIDAAALGLPGKPDPALFLEAARRLAVEPRRAILFEDALAGVEAGRRGDFCCVVGVDSGGNAAALRQRGADVVIGSLADVQVDQH